MKVPKADSDPPARGWFLKETISMRILPTKKWSKNWWKKKIRYHFHKLTFNIFQTEKEEKT
jgi:hypothetical protein